MFQLLQRLATSGQYFAAAGDDRHKFCRHALVFSRQLQGDDTPPGQATRAGEGEQGGDEGAQIRFMADHNEFVAAREVLQKLAKAGNGEVLGQEGRNLHFAGKSKGLGEDLRRLQRPRLGAGEDQVRIDLQLFQGGRNATKAPPPAAGQIALFVRKFRGRRDGLGMSDDVKFHDKE